MLSEKNGLQEMYNLYYETFQKQIKIFELQQCVHIFLLKCGKHKVSKWCVDKQTLQKELFSWKTGKFMRRT